MKLLPILLLAAAAAHAAESCTTQSRLPPATLASLTTAAQNLSLTIQSANDAALRPLLIPELDAAAVASLVAATAPRLIGGTPQLESLYLLDATTLTSPDAQFYCTLNASASEVDFTIPQLPPGRYAFAILGFNAPQPYRLSLLLRQQPDQTWHLAGLYPRALTADGHDGLWFWNQSRSLATQKEPWNSWLYLQEARSLLLPAPFVSSTHLEKLATELTAATPPAAANLSAESPLALKAADGNEFRITALSVEDALGPDKLDIAAHLKVDALGDPAQARKRNADAAAALLAAHPELRKSFHGILISAEAPNTPPYATELAMSDIH